jgi:hypothetical protein
MKRDKSHTERKGAFEISYCAKAADMVGTMRPEFRPFWNVQYLGDGTQAFFDTKRECLAWIKDWRE